MTKEGSPQLNFGLAVIQTSVSPALSPSLLGFLAYSLEQGKPSHGSLDITFWPRRT